MAACTTPPQAPLDTKVVYREHYIVPTPDPSLRTCEARPAKPDVKTNNDVAVYIAKQDERGEDCASKLAKTWQSIDQATSTATKQNTTPQ